MKRPTLARDMYLFAGRLDPNEPDDAQRIAFIQRRLKGAWTRNDLLRDMIDRMRIEQKDPTNDGRA